MAIYGFWLATRSLGLGVGWVSILDPKLVTHLLDVPEDWELIAYLAVGYPTFDSSVPELAERGWEQRDPSAGQIELR
jgi:5,6-dimethylbenzimidazole synthase